MSKSSWTTVIEIVMVVGVAGGGCVLPGEPNSGGETWADDGGDDGPGDDDGDTSTTTSGGTEGYSSSIGTTDSTVSCDGSVSATASSGPWPEPTESATGTATSGCGGCNDDDGGSDSGSLGALAACGVDYEAAAIDNVFTCACDHCSVDFSHVTPATGQAIVEACVCICDALGCGGSVSGGVTTSEPGDTGDTDGGTSSGGDPGSTTGSGTTATTSAGG
ncbi:MAG: hypothetical protein K1X88_16295 [Nannocystaceae bacterium]|nr:hypothetical protein [Nannocystaceae bacterium]